MCKNEKSDVRSIEHRIMHQIIHYANKYRKVMQSYLDVTGVYQAQHRLLMRISCNPYSSQKELAEIMEVSTATVAVSLKKLEKAGYVRKIMDKEDNRLNQVVITKEGKKIIEHSRRIFQSTEKRVFEGFIEEEKNTLFNLMERLHTNLSQMEE
ncbi:MAG: MarR family transcriptional regulator, partial [Clostridia bacterium]|nr:MarR family transcriptional regulator [Clostridia bacterium]